MIAGFSEIMCRRMTSVSHLFDVGWLPLRSSIGAIAPSEHWRWACTILVIIPSDSKPRVLRNIDLHTVTFLSPLKGSKYSLDHSQPPSFCWLVLFFTWTWLMYAANHWRHSLKESIQNRLFINALSSLKKLVIHLLLQHFLHGSKIGSFLAFLFEFLTCVLARFFFGSFSNTLVDSREDKMLDGIPMEFSTDTSAGPWLMGLGSRSGWTDMPARKID